MMDIPFVLEFKLIMHEWKNQYSLHNYNKGFISQQNKYTCEIILSSRIKKEIN